MGKLRLSFSITAFLLISHSAFALTLTAQHFDDVKSPLSDTALVAVTGLETGREVSEADIDSAEKALEALGIWREIASTQVKRQNGVALYWHGSAFPLIREIRFSGNFPLLEKRLRRLLKLRIGDPYNPNRSASDREKLAALYDEEGYFGTEVAVEQEKNADGSVNLTFAIHLGTSYLWGPIHTEGNLAIPSEVIGNRLREFRHYRPKALEQGIKELKDKYRNEGFPNIQIFTTRVSFNKTKKEVEIDLVIQEGHRLSLSFSGNHFFLDSDLKKTSGLLERPGTGTDWQLKMAKTRLIEAYREKGFADVKIEAQRLSQAFQAGQGSPLQSAFPPRESGGTGGEHSEKGSPAPLETRSQKETAVAFTVEEGKRTTVKHVSFPGAKSFSDKILQKEVLLQETAILAASPYREALLEIDRKRVEDFYHQAGFRNALVSTPTLSFSPLRDKVSLAFPVHEGDRSFIRSITFIGASTLDTATLTEKSLLQIGDAASPLAIQKAKEKIVVAYSEIGHLYAEARVEEHRDGDQVDLLLDINEGPKVILSDIVLLGNFRTDTDEILKAARLKKGAPVNLPKVLDARLNLRHFGTYQSIDLDLIGVAEKRKQVVALLRFEERPSLVNQIDIGFDTDKLVSGRYSLLRRGIFGTRQSFRVDLEGGTEFSRMAFSHQLPAIGRREWNFSETAFVQYEDDENFNAGSVGTFLNARRSVVSWLTWQIIPEIEYIDVRDLSEAARDHHRPDKDSLLGTAKTGIVIDRRDHYSDPSRGFTSTMEVAYSQEPDHLKNGFFTTNFQFAVFRKLVPRISFWHNIHADRIFTIDDNTEVPIQKLFFLGGNDTIRGFDEDTIDDSGGTFRLFHNTELHLALTQSLKLAGFLDSGFLVDQWDEINTSSLRESAGPGLRYFTPIGPLRFDYGFILDRKPGEPRGRFHVSFGFFF